jgi:glycyl-tRNA synthetase beta chain
MADVSDFLVEIGTEELPPKSLRDLELAFAEGVRSGIAAAGLASAELRSFATPRRLAVLVRELPSHQPSQAVEKRGPPLSAAFGDDGQPTRAATAFASGCGVDVTTLEKLATPKGSWLVYRAELPGKPTAELLPAIVVAALEGLPIPRRMRWGDGTDEFVRPVHWVVMLLGEAVVNAKVLGVAAGRVSRGHRFHAPAPIQLQRAADYESALQREGRVIASFDARRDRVRQFAVEAARAAGGTAVYGDALLDEVTALVEWPAPVVGSFASSFLALPEEVLTATLQGHQRYFPVRDANGRLLPRFIAIANIESADPDQVRMGNERVVLPRLTDAAFFWEQDSRTTLAARVPQLASVVFQKGLGSLQDKSGRVGQLAAVLAPALGCDAGHARRAAMLAKADLLTQMVGEFPELQGRMGRHYALRDGEAEAVAIAIDEQYLPRHAGDRLPSSAAGRTLAIADRLDTLAGAFALGKRPSGNKDPFGLRRAALGLLRVLIEGGVDIDLAAVIGQALAVQPVKASEPALATEIFDFIIERLRAYYLDGLAPGLQGGEVTAEMFEAVRSRRPPSPLDFHQRLLGVRAFMGLAEAESLAVANKRIANILRTADGGATARPDPGLFECGEERTLSDAVDNVASAHSRALDQRDYTSALRALATLKGPVDAFFDAVLVMTDDLPTRANRLALLRQLREMFLDVADLSCMPTP